MAQHCIFLHAIRRLNIESQFSHLAGLQLDHLQLQLQNLWLWRTATKLLDLSLQFGNLLQFGFDKHLVGNLGR